MIEEHDLETARRNEKNNLNRLKKEIPQELALKEDRLFDRMRTSKINSLHKLTSLYEFIDELYAFVAHYTACGKGCNHCCHYEVSISAIEVAFIEKFIKVRQKKTASVAFSHGSPCPFLKSGICSIYSARPFFCRTHVSLCNTAEWCRLEKSDSANFELLYFTEVIKSYDFIVQSSGRNEILDIKQIF